MSGTQTPETASSSIGAVERSNELDERHFNAVGRALSPDCCEPVVVDVTMHADGRETVDYTDTLRDDDVRVLRVYNRCYGISLSNRDERFDVFSAFVNVPSGASVVEFSARFPRGQIEFLPNFGGYAAALKRSMPLMVDRRTMAVFDGASRVPMQVRALRVGDPLVPSPESGTFAFEFMVLRAKCREYGKPSRLTGERKQRMTVHIERDADEVTRAFTRLRTALTRLQACDRRVCEIIESAAATDDAGVTSETDVATALGEPAEIVEDVFGPQPFIDPNNRVEESKLAASDYIYSLAEVNDAPARDSDDNDNDNADAGDDNKANADADADDDKSAPVFAAAD